MSARVVPFEAENSNDAGAAQPSTATNTAPARSPPSRRVASADASPLNGALGRTCTERDANDAS